MSETNLAIIECDGGRKFFGHKIVFFKTVKYVIKILKVV